MNFRKHHLDTHRSGAVVQIAATAFSHAATTDGERVELVDGHAVMVLGDPDPAEIERFAADVEGYANRAVRVAA